MTMSSLCDMSALKVLFLGSYFKKKNQKIFNALHSFEEEREVASLWKRSRFMLSIFSILCNITDFYLNLVFNIVLFQRRENSSQRLCKFNFLKQQGIMHFSNDFVFKELLPIFLMPHTTDEKDIQKSASI